MSWNNLLAAGLALGICAAATLLGERDLAHLALGAALAAVYNLEKKP